MDQQFKNFVFRIATPYSVGVGWWMPQRELIVTTAQAVKGNRAVIIDNAAINTQLVEVRYVDGLNGIAFLDPPKDQHLQRLSQGNDQDLQIGQKVISLGMPEYDSCRYCEGYLIEEEYEENNITYLAHDCAISYDCVGGPLLDASGKVVGLNMHVITDAADETKVFALPISVIQSIADEFMRLGRKGVRCESCSKLIPEGKKPIRKCPDCKAPLELPSFVDVYEPVGIASTIEQIIAKSERDVRITRRGPNVWEIHQGSARVNISYYDKAGLIMGDAYLCALPEKDQEEILDYLLLQNYEIEGLSFSVRGKDIVLSLLIYDGHLNVDTGYQLFQHLFERADHYDNILVEQHGAKWKRDNLKRQEA